MKKTLTFLVVAISFILLPQLARADLLGGPPPGCAKIVNLNQYPEYKVIGLFRYVGTGPGSSYVVEEDVCLTKGYKFNSFELLIGKKEYIDSIKDIKTFDPYEEIPRRDAVFIEEMNCYAVYKDGRMSVCYHGQPKEYVFKDENLKRIDTRIEPYMPGDNKYRLIQAPDGSFTLKQSTPNAIAAFISLHQMKLMTLLLTILIESFILWLLLRKSTSRKKIFSVGLIINVITQPVANFIYLYVKDGWYQAHIAEQMSLATVLIIIEAVVIIAESILISSLFKVKFTKAFVISLFINIATAVLSVFLYPLVEYLRYNIHF